MSIRTSVLSVFVVSCLVGSVSAATVPFQHTYSYQNGANGYTSEQAVGWIGNPVTIGTSKLPGHAPYAHGSAHNGTGYIDSIYQGTLGRHYTQVIRFDDVFGTGPGQISGDAPYTSIQNATLTLTLDPNNNSNNINDTSIYRAHRVLVDWSEADLGANFGPRNDTLGKPAGPDLVTPGEITPTFITSAPTNQYVITFDITSDMIYFLDHPSERFGWAFGKAPIQTGGPILLDYLLHSGGGVPLLEVTFTALPVPEPATGLLLGLGALGMISRRKRRHAKA